MLSQQLLNGLLLGATYCLVALGFTLIVGVLDRLNLALGETFMVGSFVALYLMTSAGLPFAAAAACAMLAGAAVSVVVYMVSFRAVKQEFFTAPILSSLGMGILLTTATAELFGSETRQFPNAVSGPALSLGPARIHAFQLVILAVAVVLTVALYLLVQRTELGLAIRAVAENPSVAGLLGVPVERVVLLTFALAGLLAGASGVLTGLAFHTVSPFAGLGINLKGLTIIVLGGLGNITGAIVAGLSIGMIETLSVVYLSATARDVIVFLLLLAALVFRPQGLFGTRTAERA
jgi:branched-chain amino acid transport system permease protein